VLQPVSLQPTVLWVGFIDIIGAIWCASQRRQLCIGFFFSEFEALLTMPRRVQCEFAGSGIFFKAFDFDFVRDSCDSLHSLIVGTSIKTLFGFARVRLFHNHNGPELTVDVSLFGRQRFNAEKTYQGPQVREGEVCWRALYH
jgi:hypothetical protein